MIAIQSGVTRLSQPKMKPRNSTSSKNGTNAAKHTSTMPSWLQLLGLMASSLLATVVGICQPYFSAVSSARHAAISKRLLSAALTSVRADTAGKKVAHGRAAKRLAMRHNTARVIAVMTVVTPTTQ